MRRVVSIGTKVAFLIVVTLFVLGLFDISGHHIRLEALEGPGPGFHTQDSSGNQNNANNNQDSPEAYAGSAGQTNQSADQSESTGTATSETSSNVSNSNSNTAAQGTENTAPTSPENTSTASSSSSETPSNSTNPTASPPPFAGILGLPVIPSIPNTGPTVLPPTSIVDTRLPLVTSTTSDTTSDTTSQDSSTSTTSTNSADDSTASSSQDDTNASTSATNPTTANPTQNSGSTTSSGSTTAPENTDTTTHPTPSTPPNPPAGNIFETGAVTFRFDDGWSSQLDALSILNAAGITGTFYIVTRQTGDDGFTGFMTTAQIKQIAASGQEIGAHTQTHPHLPTLSNDQQQKEIAGSKSDLSSMGISAQTFSYPYGEYTSAATQLVEQAGFGSAVTTIETSVSPSSEKYQLPSPSIQLSQSPAAIESMIDSAVSSHQWLILTFHRIDTSGDQYSITPDNFKEVVNYVQSHNIPTVTVSQGVSQLH